MVLLVDRVNEALGDDHATMSLSQGSFGIAKLYYERPKLYVVDGALASTKRRRLSSKRVFRLVRSGLLLLICLVGVDLGYSRITSTRPAVGASITYTVRPGDTLWSIVQRLDPNSDPRPLVSEIQSMVGTTVITPGEKIVVPLVH
ncbi:MAG: LysM peptidoglycan-binding domain-containing protein [Acidimicrobiaceae bacterium]|nr:LysM peptidoglycan-binding domain-containing protein [Acidimicrobiaceae bacterium]